MILLQDLRVQLQGKEILHGIDLQIERNKKTVLIGHSGSGKTTLLHTLAGFYPLSGGGIQPPIDPKDTGLLIQNFKLFPWYSVEKNILLAMHALEISTQERKPKFGPLPTIWVLGICSIAIQSESPAGKCSELPLPRCLQKIPSCC